MRVLLFLLVALLLYAQVPAQSWARPLPDTVLVCHRAATPAILGVWEDLPDSLDCVWASKDETRGASFSFARVFTERMFPGYYRFSRKILKATGDLVEEDSIVLHITKPPRVLPRDLVIPTCDNSGDGAIRLRESEGRPPMTYTWNSGQSSRAIENLNSGTYEVTVRDGNNCETKQAFALMSPEPIDIELLQKEDASCSKLNGSAVVKATGGVGDFIYSWDTDDAFTGVGLSGLEPGMYTVKAEDNRGCWDTLQVRIRDLAFRSGDIESIPSDSVAVCVRDAEFEFKAADRYADRYLWDFGDGVQKESNNPIHRFAEPGIYTVQCMMYEEGNDCPAKDSVQIEVQHDGELIIPELFSPNSDGINDYFYLRGHAQSLEFKIFNKSGRLVKTLHDLKDRWNGRNEDGRKMSKGEYTYQLRAELSVCKDFEHQGSFQLVR